MTNLTSLEVVSIDHFKFGSESKPDFYLTYAKLILFNRLQRKENSRRAGFTRSPLEIVNSGVKYVNEDKPT